MPPVAPMLAKPVPRSRRPVLRAQVGRLPRDRVPRRRRGRDRQPQGAADDAVLPRGRGGGEAQLPAARVIDGEIVIAGDDGLDFWALQQRIHPAASRVDMLAAQTPASFVAFDLLALGDDDLTRGRSRTAAPRSSGRWRRRASRPRHADHARRAGRARLVRALRGRGPGRHHRQARRPHLRARQARDDEDQARADRRLCARRLPRAQVRPTTRSAHCCSASTATTPRRGRSGWTT